MTPDRTSGGYRGATPHLVGVVVLAVLCACTGSGATGPGQYSAPTTLVAMGSSTTTTTTTTGAPDQARPFGVHLPPGYTATKPVPLLILLHGYSAPSGSSADAYFGLTPNADAHGMLYVHPDGTRDQWGHRFWNATDACCQFGSPIIDDSTYLAQLIGQVRERYAVDAKKVFIVGYSNGGFMAYRVACDHADLVAAIVSIEAATWANPSRCQPSEPVTVLEVHGTADQTVKYAGGTMGAGAYPSARATASMWAAYDGCSTIADPSSRLPRELELGLPPATVTSYSTNCRPGGHVELWTQPSGTHVPRWSPTFVEQVLSYLQAHPKA